MDNVRRFLRADRGHLPKATKRLKETLRWRLEERPETRMCGACLNNDLRSHYMHHCGWDRRGRALVFSDIGMARDKAPNTNYEHCMQVLELLEPALAPFPNDQYIWVVDFHKFSVADCNPQVARACLSLFGRSYPERLGGMIMVGAPMLFSGFYRVVSAFADPVTVKKVRFVKGPDGKGGGKALAPVLKEFFDEETAAWLVAEMTENRQRWKGYAREKSWLAATAAGDGTRHGWWENDGARAKNENMGSGRSGVASDNGHDIRGCPSFVRSAACARMCRAARRHAQDGLKTRGAVMEAVHRNPAAAGSPEDGSLDSDDDIFYEAEDHSISCATVKL